MPSPVTVTGVVSVLETSPVVAPSSRHWMRLMPEAPLSSAVMLIRVDGVVIQPVGITVVSAGPWMSTHTAWSAHALALPTSSITRVRKLCWPWMLTWTTVPAGPEPIGCALSCHSTRSTPESASVPLTVTLTGPFCQPTGVTVVSAGSVSSIFTVSLRSVRLPASSTAAVSSWCVPVPVTVAELPVVQEPPPTRHSVCTSEVASVPVRATLTGPFCQAVVGGMVVFAGTVASMRTKWSVHSVQLTPSWARCESRCVPLPVIGTVPPAPITLTVPPQSTLYSHCVAPAPISGTSTLPAGEPCCHAPDGAVASTVESGERHAGPWCRGRRSPPTPAPERPGRRKRARVRLCESEGSRPGYRQVSSDLQSAAIRDPCERKPQRSRGRSRCPLRARSPRSRPRW